MNLSDLRVALRQIIPFVNKLLVQILVPALLGGDLCVAAAASASTAAKDTVLVEAAIRTAFVVSPTRT